MKVPTRGGASRRLQSTTTSDCGARSSESRRDGPRLTYLRALDGLRGIAVLAVVLYHFAPGRAPGGFIGVDIFFVLSGFLITSLLVNEWEVGRRISLLAFWGRRARRLLPALFLVLGAVGIYVLFTSNRADAHRIGEDSLAALGYVANWHFISSGQSYVERILQSAPSPLRHTWSLAIEEQFYLVWPLVIGLLGAIVARTTTRRAQQPARDRRRFRHALVAVCLTGGVASFVWMLVLFDANNPSRVYYGTDTRAFLLLLGAAVGALTAGAPTVARRLPRVLLVIVGCAAALALVATMAKVQATDTRLYRGGYGLVAIAITLVLVAAVQPGLNPLGRVLESRALVGLGLISYGIYLWHWPVTVWMTEQRTGLSGASLFALRSGVTLAVALASYVIVEQPIRRGQLPRIGGWNRAVVPLGTVTALTGLLLVPVLAFPSVNPTPKIPPSRASQSVSLAYASAPRCDRSTAAAKPVADGHHPRIQLFGNSIAEEISECLATIVNARGATFESVVQTGTAPCHLLPRLREQVTNPATRPDIAIFSAAIFGYERTCASADANWLVQVREALDIWTQAGTHVYLVPIVPHIPSTAPKVSYVPAQTPEFQALAAQDPAHITVLDAGMFIRDSKGVYQWRMPCLPWGEPGCDSNHTVGVRWVDGSHYCADPHFLFLEGNVCKPRDAGGDRRVAAAIALQITELSPPSTGASKSFSNRAFAPKRE